MAKKPPPVPMLKGEKLVVPHFDEETGRVVYKVLFDPLPEPKPSPPTATAKRAMIVAIVRRDFPRRSLPNIATIHRHIRDLAWNKECARQKPPVKLGAPGRDTITYALQDAGLLKPKPRAKPLTK